MSTTNGSQTPAFIGNTMTEALIDEYYATLSNFEHDKSTINLNGLFGMPPIFASSENEETDALNPYGEDFMTRFIDEGNMVLIQACVPNFLPNMSDKAKLNFIKNSLTGGDIKNADDFLQNGRKMKKNQLLGMKSDMVTYWKQVQMIAGSMAVQLGVNDLGKGIPAIGTTFSLFDYGKYQSKFLQQEANKDDSLYWENVVFYNDGPIEVSDSTSHVTAESSLARNTNSSPLKATAREFSMLTNQDVSESNLKRVTNGAGEEVVGAYSDLFGKTKGIAKNAIDSNIVIPEVYQDTSFDKTVQLKFKFTSVHSSNLDIFLHTLLPLAHVIALAGATMSGKTIAYKTPWLVKVHVHGVISIPCGMITNVQVIRHPESVNSSGLATEIDVVLTVKDLYPVVAIPRITSDFNLRELHYMVFASEGLFHYISPMCGINSVKRDLMNEFVGSFGSTIAGVKNLPRAIGSFFGYKAARMGQWLDNASDRSVIISGIQRAFR